ncbi:MAG: hypothetical protein KDK28_00995 [Maritimibacter sp.]|nr:hypothetical protein [Maritimibacter sp.]
MAPMNPLDLFAAVGHLCKVGGVVSFFEPSPYRADNALCEFVLTKEDRVLADEAGREWRDIERDGHPPEEVYRLWDVLTAAWDESVTPGECVDRRTGPPAWWRAALLLLMIADMACNRIMRDAMKKYKPSHFEHWMKTRYTITSNRPNAEGEHHGRPPASLSMLADSSVACVMPKVRVSGVGAALRNLSRNLALLPGRGEVRCHWEKPINAPPSENSETLDILLIPEPRRIMASDFQPAHYEGEADAELNYWVRDWSTFRINQSWIEGERESAQFIEECVTLMQAAKAESRAVNGVILPEFAVNDALFGALCDRLKAIEERLEFVIAGTSENCENDHGNHVMTRVWYSTRGATLTQSRRKHHRWRMDRSQVATYALSSALNPLIKNWWEDTPIGRRELQFQRFRTASVFSVLICEELARSDPCHEILRSVAPNLIFALLMDGPQIRERWPAQYASNLADDPGSAVLTFTSYGLIERANAQGHHEKNDAIALWKDDRGKVVQIDMPPGQGPRGILLSLWSEHVVDRTITGKNSEVRAWRYANHLPVYASTPRTLPSPTLPASKVRPQKRMPLRARSRRGLAGRVR